MTMEFLAQDPVRCKKSSWISNFYKK